MPGRGRVEVLRPVSWHAAVVWFDLHVPESRSLKAKRAAIRPIVDTLRHRYHVSVAEVGFQEQWQRARVAVAVVASTHRHLEEILGTVERFVERAPSIEVLGSGRSDVEDDER